MAKVALSTYTVGIRERRNADYERHHNIISHLFNDIQQSRQEFERQVRLFIQMRNLF
jgi:hypothetical protein